MKTVAIPMKTVARAMKTVVVATSSRNFLCIFETQSVFVLLQAILRELSFITLSAFPSFGNQKERFLERAAHLTSSVVRQEGINHEKSQSKIDQDFGRNRKIASKGGYCIKRHEMSCRLITIIPLRPEPDYHLHLLPGLFLQQLLQHRYRR